MGIITYELGAMKVLMEGGGEVKIKNELWQLRGVGGGVGEGHWVEVREEGGGGRGGRGR